MADSSPMTDTSGGRVARQERRDETEELHRQARRWVAAGCPGSTSGGITWPLDSQIVPPFTYCTAPVTEAEFDTLQAAVKSVPFETGVCQQDAWDAERAAGALRRRAEIRMNAWAAAVLAWPHGEKPPEAGMRVVSTTITCRCGERYTTRMEFERHFEAYLTGRPGGSDGLG